MGYRNKELQRAYQKEWLKKRREEFFSGQSCVQCGSTEDLQLDHVDRNEKVNHRIWSWSEPRRKEEIKKCQILCFACHKQKTFGEMKYGGHSTSGYRRGCRCGICRQAAVDAVNQYRWKTGRRIAR